MSKRLLQSFQTHFKIFGVRGVIARAYAALPGNNGLFHAKVKGMPAPVTIRLGTTDTSAFEHVFLNDEYNFNKAGFTLAKSPSVIVDAGANVGMSARYFAHQYPSAKIIAIEPDRRNFEMLRENTAAHPSITPVHAAVWNHENGVDIESTPGGAWGFQTHDSPSGPVPSVTIDALMRKHSIDHIDLLKVDIEGAEYELFDNTPEWVNRVDMICTELHDRFRPGCTEAFNKATSSFPIRWTQGELTCVARKHTVIANTYTKSH